jgi:cyclic peptide transporter
MIASLLRRNRGWLLMTTVASAVAGLMNMWLVKLATDYAVAAIGRYAIALGLMFGIGMTFQQIMSALSGRIFYQARKELTARVSALTYQGIERIGRHRVFTSLTHDLGDLNQLVTLVPSYVFNATVTLACLLYLSTISPKLFAIVLLFLTFGLSTSRRYIFRHGEARFRELRKIQDQLFLCYQGVVDGHKELALHGARKQRFHQNELDSASVDYRAKSLQAAFFWNLANNWNTAVVFAAIGVVIFASTFLLQLPTAKLLPFIVVILYVTGPISQLLNGLRVIARAQVAMARLRDLGIFDAELPLQTDDRERNQRAPFATLELRGVRYAYKAESKDEEGFAVGPIDLRIDRGDLIYLVGGNGSGKTTCARLIAGLYARTEGDVLLNGCAVDAEPPSSYLEYFSAIFADYHLFSDLLPKTANGADPKTVEAMLEQLQLSDKTQVNASRIEHTKLSQGLRKRLALLAACCDDSEIYVFDEWAAEQDPPFRDYFYREFLPEMKRKGKTVIVVTHDDRYFELADKLIKFERGRIICQTDDASLGPEGDLRWAAGESLVEVETRR